MKRWLLVLVGCVAVACSDDQTATGFNNLSEPSNNALPDGDTPDAGQPVDLGADADTRDTGTQDADVSDVAVADVGPADVSVNDAAQDVSSDTGSPVTDVYTLGPHEVARLQIAAANGLNKDIIVHHPLNAGSYPLVVIQHGFALRNSAYDAMAKHVASHGYVVVAPQMYTGAFSAPNTVQEAADAQQLYDWLRANLATRLPVAPDATRFAVAGHSRGGKVAWRVLLNGYDGIDAVVGIDPVDGTGGPLGGDTRIASAPFGFSLPTLVLGAGLGSQAVFGQACAPQGDNHEVFYAATQSPSYHVIAPDYGHLDMIECGALCRTCVQGPDAKFKVATAGLMVAFLNAALKGDANGYRQLGEVAPVTTQFESK